MPVELEQGESHYPVHKLEFLSIKWAVVKKFHEHLYGLTFDMYTDNNPYLMSSPQPSWMQPVITGLPVWQTTISGYTTELERLISMKTPCSEYPGQDVFLMTQIHILRSQLQQCKPCKRLPLKVQAVLLRPTVMICMSWMQFRTVSRSPV